jgi:hypothetical protein
MNLNRALFVGNLTANPELIYTPKGTKCELFCVFVPRVPSAYIAELPSPGQKSQERVQLKKCR